MGEWDSPYKTMNYGYEAEIIRTLARIVHNNHLHKGFKPVHWCTDCGSALAEAEVEYQDKVSPAIDVAFNVVDVDRLAEVSQLNDASGFAVVIWTTTPWTLPANEAVTVHPDLDYVLVEATDEDENAKRLILAKELMSSCLERFGLSNENVLAEVCLLYTSPSPRDA